MSTKYLQVSILALFIVVSIYVGIEYLKGTYYNIFFAIILFPFIFMLISKGIIPLTDFFDENTVKKLKTFTKETPGDLFPKGFYGMEFSYYSELAVGSIVSLFALLIRNSDKSKLQSALDICHAYFEKRFHTSHRVSFFETDETMMKRTIIQKLHAKLPIYQQLGIYILNSKMPYEARMEFTEQLFRVGQVLYGIDNDVCLWLEKISYYLLIEEWDVINFEYRYGFRQENNENQTVQYNLLTQSYQILGLTETSSDNDVKSAYRTLVKKCHPDLLPSTATPKEIENAITLFRQVTEAYTKICQSRNI